MKDKFQKKDELQKRLQREQSENDLRIFTNANKWYPSPSRNLTQKYTNDYN